MANKKTAFSIETLPCRMRRAVDLQVLPLGGDANYLRVRSSLCDADCWYLSSVRGACDYRAAACVSVCACVRARACVRMCIIMRESVCVCAWCAYGRFSLSVLVCARACIHNFACLHVVYEQLCVGPYLHLPRVCSNESFSTPVRFYESHLK